MAVGGDPEGGVRTVRLRLRPGRERPVEEGHPWVFSGAIASQAGDSQAPIASVESADGRPLGIGLHSPGARIRVRMLGRDPERVVDRALFAERLERALALRREVVGEDTDGYRLLNAEGDGLPGWTVDRFGDVLVSQITSAGLEMLRDDAYAALAEAAPGTAILHLGDLAARRSEGLATENVTIRGQVPGEVDFRENGLVVTAEIGSGQKTGWYCDQRENRRRFGELASGRRVLDLFAHTGGFALHALAAGAVSARLVESSQRLTATAARLLTRNGLEEGRATIDTADVFAFLREPGDPADLMALDPPPLARRRGDVERAARAYKDVNRLALGRLAPGGFLMTFSCSAAVDSRLFRQILFAAAAEASVAVQLLEPLAAAPDHPVDLAHLEGEYLKGWLVRSLGPR
ncbi:MAG: class I SAM-dependent rRNA methyltransferase [Acidobacteria bacterium]|nr:class I SAM-dependent rRNA methyltransferase [Acidobacteriota bacterium]MCB9377747.1 class I SAM-dependent rRNA methyltransferase [Holophagales bacterium]